MAQANIYLLVIIVTFFLILLVLVAQRIFNNTGKIYKEPPKKKSVFSVSKKDDQLLNELRHHQEMMRELKKASLDAKLQKQNGSKSQHSSKAVLSLSKTTNKHSSLSQTSFYPQVLTKQDPKDLIEEIVLHDSSSEDLAKDFWFVSHNGAIAKNISELVQIVERMDQKTFSMHVTEHKNDFAQWIEQVFGDASLGRMLRSDPKKENVLSVLKEVL